VHDRQGARQVGEEDETRLQASDQDRLSAGVVPADLLAELGDASPDLAGGQIDLPDPPVGRRRGDGAEGV